LVSIAADVKRIADHLAPVQRGEIVGTRHVADRRGESTQWITQQARDGRIPAKCIVSRGGKHKRWKFRRPEIDEWADSQ
jgi:hypothetical protein